MKRWMKNLLIAGGVMIALGILAVGAAGAAGGLRLSENAAGNAAYYIIHWLDTVRSEEKDVSAAKTADGHGSHPELSGLWEEWDGEEEPEGDLSGLEETLKELGEELEREAYEGGDWEQAGKSRKDLGSWPLNGEQEIDIDADTFKIVVKTEEGMSGQARLFAVSGEEDELSVRNEEGTLFVEAAGYFKDGRGSLDRDGSVLVICLPQDFAAKRLRISGDSMILAAEGMEAGQITADVQASILELGDMKAQEAKITSDMCIVKLEADAESICLDSAESVAQVRLKGREEDYNYSVSGETSFVRIGEGTISAGLSLKDKRTDNEGSRQLEINADDSKVQVDFEESLGEEER